MFGRLAEASTLLDIGTLFVIAICVTSLLGLLLLFAWMQDRITALAWWGVAYLLGGLSGAIWRLGEAVSPPLPESAANILLFVAVGMIWNAARLFHGRSVQWGAMFLGAGAWVAALLSPAFEQSAASRLVVSSLIVATYTFLTAAELWRERRQSLIRRWPAVFVPMLHGVIFLFPVALAGLSIDGAGANARTFGTGWVAVYAIEVVLYVVGAAFVVLVLAKDRTVRQYQIAAATDPLTEVLNRRGFFEAAVGLTTAQLPSMAPVSVLAFDLDHFKSINDRFGHHTGDAMLKLFASVVRKTMRATDIIGRLGGEEFVAIVPGNLAEATIAAERVRRAFEWAALDPDGLQIPATVTVGIACGAPNVPVETLITRADAALYRAKANGRNRTESADEALDGTVEPRPDLRGAGNTAAAPARAPAALAVPIVR